jgi:hypothetical protein
MDSLNDIARALIRSTGCGMTALAASDTSTFLKIRAMQITSMPLPPQMAIFMQTFTAIGFSQQPGCATGGLTPNIPVGARPENSARGMQW